MRGVDQNLALGTFEDMTYSRSRAISAATAAYGLFALARPRHLGDALEAPHVQRPAIDQVAYTYGARDISMSALGCWAPRRWSGPRWRCASPVT